MTALAKTYDEPQLKIVTDYMDAARTVLEAEAAKLRSAPAVRTIVRKGAGAAKPQKSRTRSLES